MEKQRTAREALEPLPKLHYRLDVKDTAAYSPKTDSWMPYDNPDMVEERIFSSYDFVTTSGYHSEGRNIPVDGRAVYMEYDDAKLQYRKKTALHRRPLLLCIEKNGAAQRQFPKRHRSELPRLDQYVSYADRPEAL